MLPGQTGLPTMERQYTGAPARIVAADSRSFRLIICAKCSRAQTTRGRLQPRIDSRQGSFTVTASDASAASTCFALADA